ncbi:ANKRD28 [Mytilus coruscus]|uniref:ANKRD28 n=1 Tax=Mytilus coruscus TaxID=42192 RepID=A0A6J8CN22_MYTCO|nr:ANKRD28 [Mytilus coruscus]
MIVEEPVSMGLHVVGKLNIDITDDCGRTCLHGAACSGKVDCVELLLKTGANISQLDVEGRTPLHYAAAHINFQCVSILLDTGSNVNITDRRGCTPLHYAAASDPDAKSQKQSDLHLYLYKFLGIIAAFHKKLLDAAATDLLRSGARYSPAHLAAYNGHSDALNVLLGCIMNLDIRDYHGRTMLDLACYKGHHECVETLLLQGATILVQDGQTRRTPLHAAALNGHTECLRLLLETADDNNIVDCTDSFDRTPLMHAVSNGHAANGHEECVDAMLHNGADISIQDSLGRTSLHLAAACGQVAILGALLLTGPLPSIEDRRGYCPLHLACYNGHDGCVEVLLEYEQHKVFSGNLFSPLHCAVINGNDSCTEILIETLGDSIVNCTDTKGRSALHAAAFSDQCESMQLLLTHGVSVNYCDKTGKSPVMLAAANGHAAAVELLLENGADLSFVDCDKNSALHFACAHEHENVALLLLDKIDDSGTINLPNAEQKTPLHLACKYGLVSIVQDLISKGGNVLAVDENGHSPALACAPTNRVAECLAIVLAHMPFSQPPNNTFQRRNRSESSPSAPFGATRTLDNPGSPAGIGSPAGSVQDVKEHSGSYQSSDSEFY